jgi:hypothetical protein
MFTKRLKVIAKGLAYGGLYYLAGVGLASYGGPEQPVAVQAACVLPGLVLVTVGGLFVFMGTLAGLFAFDDEIDELLAK